MRIEKTETGNYFVRDELPFRMGDIANAWTRIRDEDGVNVLDWPLSVEYLGGTFWQLTFFAPLEAYS